MEIPAHLRGVVTAPFRGFDRVLQERLDAGLILDAGEVLYYGDGTRMVPFEPDLHSRYMAMAAHLMVPDSAEWWRT